MRHARDAALSLAILAVAAPSLAQQGLPVELPTQERASDLPPTGIAIAPDLTVSGYGTLQLLAPMGSGVAPPATLSAAAANSVDDAQYSRRARLGLSHLSGIAWWTPSPSWKVLGEVDLQDVVQIPDHVDREDGPGSAPYVALERAYVDYRASDALSFRAGKFLTPVGRWNQDHSDPQTWTVLRPLISQSAFPTNVTGLMAFGSVPLLSQWIDYQAYASNGGEWRASPRVRPFDRGFGGRISTDLDPRFQLGVSASRFSRSEFPDGEFKLLGLDARWNWRRAEVSVEAVQRKPDSGNTGEEHGWFLQAAVPVATHWWLTSRIEGYQRVVDSGAHRSVLLGATYRSGDHWIFKVEWVDPSPDAIGLPAGFLSSLTFTY